LFRKRRNYNQEQFEMQINLMLEDDIYSCIFITGDNQLPLANFFVHVDKDEKILHIYNQYVSGEKTVMNLLSRPFIDEVKKGLKIKRGKYDVYLYMPPVNSNNILLATYGYKADGFIGRSKAKEYKKFIEMAEEHVEDNGYIFNK